MVLQHQGRRIRRLRRPTFDERRQGLRRTTRRMRPVHRQHRLSLLRAQQMDRAYSDSHVPRHSCQHLLIAVQQAFDSRRHEEVAVVFHRDEQPAVLILNRHR